MEPVFVACAKRPFHVSCTAMRTILLSISALSLACGATEGESCRLQSDCEPGLMCFEGKCITQAVAADALSYHDTGSSRVTPSDDAATEPNADAAVVQTHPCGEQPYSKILLACAEPRNIFAARSGTCEEPSGKYSVRSIVMEPEGGFAKMAPVASPVIKNGLDDGTIKVELWRDGDFALNCDGKSAWMIDESDRAADCTAKYAANSFPLLIPIGSGLHIVIDDVQFDLNNGRMTGRVDRQKLVADLPEALRPVAEGLIAADVDTDGDGTPEDSTVTLTVCFQ
jgi:hypothetical protein